jgi:hypothetical protein
MELGWTLLKRRAHLDDLKKSGVITEQRLDFQDKLQALPVVSVPIGLAKYRLLNGRTASLQEEWLAGHPEASDEFFRRDPEFIEAQRVQHELLTKLVSGGGLLVYFRDAANKQKDAIILDSNGFVINGNRRLCAWRNLFTENSSKYAHFSHVDALLLPPADDRAIDKLEGALQVEPDIRDDYTWDSLANMMRQRQLLHKLDDTALATFYKMPEKRVRELRDMLEYASVYLGSRGRPRHWSQVSTKEFAFRKMVEKRRTFTDVGEKKLFEECAFSLIDDPTGGRLYELIPELQRFLPTVRARLLEEYPLKTTSPKGGNADDMLFGGINDKSQADIELAETISQPEHRSDVSILIKGAIDSERQLKKDEESINYVVKRLQQANSEIQSAISGIRAESSRAGAKEQIDAIRDGLAKLATWAQE